jgi:signal transduction histidine kinase
LHTLVQLASGLCLVAFAALGLLALRQWRARRDPAAMWIACSFVALGVVVLVARAVPERPDRLYEHVLQRLLIVVLLLFPYLLYRFTLAFRQASVTLDRVLGGMTGAMVLWTLVLPHRLPAAGEPRPLWVLAYLAAFLVHWTVMSLVVAVRLWRAGRREPSVARRRMQMLALAAATITIAIFVSVGSNGADSPAALVSQLLALASAFCFWFGLAPPRHLRAVWRLPEQQRLQEAIQDLMGVASSEQEVVLRVLEPMAAIVGARAIRIRNAAGAVIGRFERDTDVLEDAAVVDVPMANGNVEVTTSRYAPYFGVEELNLIRTLGALTGLALDRGRLSAQEREALMALQRADQLKTDFVALAAHELRTPVTAIHGFVHTLGALGDRLDPESRREVSVALEQQTARMVGLVEQLLDLSRLDAEAVSIDPQPMNVKERLQEVVNAAGADPDVIELDVPDGLEARLDANVIERVVTNLVTNALRYGAPPVLVTAERRDRHVRIAVEDRGEGIPPEFVPTMFDRFARSERARVKSGGTGLGLAIARSYARAHRGDLLYTPASPHGSRFEVVLPAGDGERTAGREAP